MLLRLHWNDLLARINEVESVIPKGGFYVVQLHYNLGRNEDIDR